MIVASASPDVYRVLRFSTGPALQDPRQSNNNAGDGGTAVKSFTEPQLPSPVLQRSPGNGDHHAQGNNNSLLEAAHAADAQNSMDISGSSYATVGRAATRLMPTYANSSAAADSLQQLPPTSEDSSTNRSTGAFEQDAGGGGFATQSSLRRGYYNFTVDGSLNAAASGGPPALSLSTLMGQTRLVHAKLAHLRTDLDALLSSITVDKPNRCRLPLLIAKGEEDVWDPPTLAQLVSSNSVLSDALDTVFRIQQSLVHTRRLLTNALEMPMREQQQQLQQQSQHSGGGLGSRFAGGGATTMLLYPVMAGKILSTAASVARREEMSVQFALEELRILKNELAKFGDRVAKVEAVVLQALGVRAGGGSATNATSASVSGTYDPRAAIAEGPSAAPPRYVARRRADANLDAIREQVESAMHRDAKFRPLLRKKSAEAVARSAGPAGTTATSGAGGQLHALKSKSAFLAEMEELEQKIAREKETQRRVSSFPITGGANVGPPDEDDVGKDSPFLAVERDSKVPTNADKKPSPSGDLVDELSHEISSALGAEVVVDADPDATAPSAPHSDVDASRFLVEGDDDNAVAVENLGADSTAAAVSDTTDRPVAEEAEQPMLSLSVPTTAPRVNFHERVSAWVKAFLVDSACQWIACEDEDKKTFYFHLETGERVTDLGEYFSDVVAESVVRELLAVGEADGLGWTLVPPGTVDAAQETEYYCHQASGEVTWSLLQWVKEH